MPNSSKGRGFRVLVTDKIDQSGIDILSTVASVDAKTKLSEEEIVEIIGEYDALMVRSGTQVTEKVIAAGKKLKIIGRAGVGVDNVDVKTATLMGIFVVNSPLGNTIAAAEHTLALMMALSRHIAPADASMRSGRWDRANFMGSQLQGKTLGVVGLGQVGAHVAKVAREMGMTLLAFDPYVNTAKAASLGCEIVALDTIYENSDFITLHVPLVPETKHLINGDSIRKMKKTCQLINASRGGVIDEDALAVALMEQRLGGAALDVFETEKAFSLDNPLLAAPNLLLTPHLGASTAEAQVNVAVDVAQQIKDTLMDRLPQSAVNIPGLRASELQEVMPVISCCDVLGKIAAQLLKTPLEKVSVTIHGAYCDIKGESLLYAVAKGALAARLTRPVNFVNVRQIADDSKVGLIVSKETSHTKSAVHISLTGGDGEVVTVKGTATEEGHALLSALQNVPLYMLLPKECRRQPFLVTTHDDSPGVLGLITTTLGNAGVNIGNMHLGRETNFGVAIASIDTEELPSDILARIAASEKVKECMVFVI